jgi:hypothetical protein
MEKQDITNKTVGEALSEMSTSEGKPMRVKTYEALGSIYLAPELEKEQG